MTISDLTNTKGDRLDPSKLKGQQSLFSTSSTWLAAHQEKPSDTEWKLWAQANRLWSDVEGKLHQPLGHWIQQLPKRRIQHFAYTSRHKLFVRNQHGYIKCRRLRNGVYEENANKLVSIHALPANVIPVEVEPVDQTRWKVTDVTYLFHQPAQTSRDCATFDEYLANLDAWEYDLLRHTTLFADPYTISLEHQTDFRAGSDGSEKHGTEGAFGWMISNREGKRTASGMGPSRGLRMDSYRAECSGMLSLLRFLVRIGEYTQRVEVWSGKIGTDSKSMLEKLFGERNLREQTELGVECLQELDVLTAEWDLLNEIQITLRQLQNVKLKHVKGHQDATRDYQTLPIMAQLNINADEKAREYQREYGKAHPFVLMSPNAGAHVLFPGGTLTAKYIPEMRYQSTGPPLRQYIQTKYNWSEETMNKINWEAHAKALEAQINRRVHLTKLVHDCLPTYHRLNRYDTGIRKCPGCQQADETRDHILRCSYPKYQAWREQFKKAMQDFHDKNRTSPLLITVWNETLEDWFSATSEEVEVSPILFPRAVRQVILQQNRIGWRQIFNGRFAKEWAQVQDVYYSVQRESASEGGHTSRRKRKETGLQWQQKFIQEIWKQWMHLWKSRNELVHGSNITTRNSVLQENANRELRTIYDHREQLEPQTRQLLFNEVQEHLQRPSWVTRNWITINAPVFKASLRNAKKRAVNGVRSIRTYFPPVAR